MLKDKGGMRLVRSFLIVSVLGLMVATPAMAQNDPMAMTHLAAANQLGILEYCQSQGFIDGATIDSQKAVMTHLPASNVLTSDAEATGKSGTLLAPNGTQTSLPQMASTHNTTVSALCKQMASSVQQAAAAYSQNGGSSMTMPTMPSMPKIPTMPGMPATTTGSGN